MGVTVITASRHGSTTGIGEAIASRLRVHGHRVDTTDADEAVLPPRDEAVVLGSPIYMGNWLKPARRLAAEPSEDRERVGRGSS